MVAQIEVWMEVAGQPLQVGCAHFNLRAGALSTVFVYDDTYLANPQAYPIDPAFPLAHASHYASGLPGCFRDSSPDRWGRNLIAKQLRQEALEAGAPLRTIDEVDYLLGVSDILRQGALQFRVPPSEKFVAEHVKVPPLKSLPELLDASGVAADKDDWAHVKTLLAAGSASLGGARPKASVADGDALWLAKFPHTSDMWDVMAWEKTAMDLAQACGLEVPVTKLVRLGGKSVFLTQRFDRSAAGGRVPYISAMTLLGAQDGEMHDYAELVDAIPALVHKVDDALRELFARVAFGVCINNTDDHLRNTGFVRADGSWRLSPLFDVNPNLAVGAARATSVMGKTGLDAACTLLDFARYCGISDAAAREIVGGVVETVEASWQAAAKRSRCPAAEQRLFAALLQQTTQLLKALIS